MDIITYQNDYGHSMLDKAETESRNAFDVMEKTGALFDVYYPPATWGYDEDHPTVESGKNQGLPLYKWVVRKDTNEPLGLHSGTFAESGSYRQVAAMAEKMFPNSSKTCTLFGKGERMALTQNIGDQIDLGDGDVIQPSIMWISSFNGQWSTAVYDLIGRLFCTNQLVGQTPLFSVKHTRNHDVTFEQRTSVLTQAIQRAEQVGRMAKIMKDQELVDSEFSDLIKKVVPMPPFIKDEHGADTDRIHARAETRMIANRGAMNAMWQKECTEFGTVRKHLVSPSRQVEVFDGNKWLAYNAIQGAEQHQISTNFMTTTQAQEKSLTKAVNGRTPYAEKAWNILVDAN